MGPFFKRIKKIRDLFNGTKLNTKSQLEIYKELGSIKIGKNSIVKDINIQIRKNKTSKQYLNIGDESVINGSFVFENLKGSIDVGDRTFIGGGSFVSIDSITIGNDVLISWGCTIMDNNAHSLRWSERKDDVSEWKKGIDENRIGHYKNWDHVKSSPIIIKDKAWIGFEVVILKGVTIGEGAIIGSRSVVTKDVRDWTIVAGNPAKIIREIPESER